MVCLEGSQIIRAAERLEINLSTAKYIVRSFRKDGKILKKTDEAAINEEEVEARIEVVR